MGLALVACLVFVACLVCVAGLKFAGPAIAVDYASTPFQPLSAVTASSRSPSAPMTFNCSGKLLVASPHLDEENFRRSVILIATHNDQGAFGLVINRVTERRLRDVIGDELGDKKVREEDTIFSGGPVEGPIMAVHDLAGIGQPCGSDQNATKFEWNENPGEPFGELNLSFDPSPFWITADDDHIRILATRKDGSVRFIVHYSGWGPKQLEYEFEQGGWIVGDSDPDIIFGDPDQAWEKAVRRCGQDILSGIDPDLKFGDPNLN